MYSVYILILPMVETWYLLFRRFVIIDDRTTVDLPFFLHPLFHKGTLHCGLGTLSFIGKYE